MNDLQTLIAFFIFSWFCIGWTLTTIFKPLVFKHYPKIKNWIDIKIPYRNPFPVKGKYNLYEQDHTYTFHYNDDYLPLILIACGLNKGYHILGTPTLTEAFTMTLMLYNKETKDTKIYIIERN